MRESWPFRCDRSKVFFAWVTCAAVLHRLRREEFLPPETIFYAVALAGTSRQEGCQLTAQAILAYVRDHLPRVLQIGGPETIGKGLCAVRLTDIV